MEKWFFECEIRDVGDFVHLLKTHKNDSARMRVLRDHHLFERAMGYCLIENEKNLKSRDLKELLREFINDHG